MSKKEIELLKFLDETPAKKYEKYNPSAAAVRSNLIAKDAANSISKIDPNALPPLKNFPKVDLKNKAKTKPKKLRGSRYARIAVATTVAAVLAAFALSRCSPSTEPVQEPVAMSGPEVPGNQTNDNLSKNNIEENNSTKEKELPILIDTSSNSPDFSGNIDQNLLLYNYKQNVKEIYKLLTGTELGDFYINQPERIEYSTNKETGKCYHTNDNNAEYRNPDNYTVKTGTRYTFYKGTPPSPNDPHKENEVLVSCDVDSNTGNIIIYDDRQTPNDPFLEKIAMATREALENAAKFQYRVEDSYWIGNIEELKKSVDEAYNTPLKDGYEELLLYKDQENKDQETQSHKDEIDF